MVLMTKSLKNLQQKGGKIFFDLTISRPSERTSKLQKKPSALKRKHPALQNMKFLNSFLLLWVIFALLDPDPVSDLTESGSNPDPKH
jgi:hypothetical protein